MSTTPGIHFPHVDGLRAVAVLAVLVFHLNPRWLPGGFVGVDVFFVISGFVVTSAMARHVAETPFHFLGGFYARRLVRIIPALLAMLSITALLSTLVIPRYWLTSIGDGIATDAFFGISNIRLQATQESYYSARLGFIPYVHTWSLGVEEQFYLISPLLLLAVFRWMRVGGPRDRWRIWPAALLLIPTAMSLRFQVTSQSTQPLTAFFSVGSRFWELAVGALLAIAFIFRTDSAPTISRPLRTGAIITGLLALVGMVASFVVLDEDGFPWPTVLAPVICTLMFIAATSLLHLGQSPGVVLLPTSLAPVVAIGRRSYSLYLWHWPVIVMMRWTIGIEGFWRKAVAVALSFAFAELSFRLVEPVFRRSSTLRGWPNWKKNFGILCLLPIGATAVTTLTEQSDKLSLTMVSRHPDKWTASTFEAGTGATRNCVVAIKNNDWSVVHQPTCASIQPLQERTLFVVGDSHAAHYNAALEQISAESGLTIHVVYSPGCPYVDLLTTSSCVAENDRIRSKVLASAQAGDVVFLSSLRSKRISELWADRWTPEREEAAKREMSSLQEPQKRSQLIGEAQEWIRPFTDRNVRVLINLPLPVFRAPAIRCSDWFNRLNNVCAGGLSIERETIETLRSPVVEMIQDLEANNSRISSWDPLPEICPTAHCESMLGTSPLFIDGDHLGIKGNELVLPSLRSKLVEQFR